MEVKPITAVSTLDQIQHETANLIKLVYCEDWFMESTIDYNYNSLALALVILSIYKYII